MLVSSVTVEGEPAAQVLERFFGTIDRTEDGSFEVDLFNARVPMFSLGRGRHVEEYRSNCGDDFLFALVDGQLTTNPPCPTC